MLNMQHSCTFQSTFIVRQVHVHESRRIDGVAPQELRHVTSSRQLDTGTWNFTLWRSPNTVGVNDRSASPVWGITGSTADSCGGCCLGCQISSFSSLHVLHELREYMIELFGTILHVLVCSTQQQQPTPGNIVECWCHTSRTAHMLTRHVADPQVPLQ